jgi:hypothetical protein
MTSGRSLAKSHAAQHSLSSRRASDGALASSSHGHTATLISARSSNDDHSIISVGRFIAKSGAQSCWEAIGPARAIFLTIGPVIKQWLDTYSEPMPSWITWSLYMIGYTPEASAPTIIFCSPNEPQRKAIRNSTRDSGMLDKYTGLVLKHLPRAPDYNQLIQLASYSGLQGMDEHEPHVLSPFGYPVFSTSYRLQMGQSLCVSSSNYRKATAGGTIRISGIDCVLTAAHAFHDALVHSFESDHLEEDLCFSHSDDGSSLSTPSYISDVHTSHDAYGHLSPRSSWSSSVTLPPISDCAALHLETESSNMQERRETNIQLCDRSQTFEPPVNACHTGDALFLSSQGMHEELDYAIIRPRSESKSINKDDDITFPSFVKLNKENELATS